MSKVTPFKAYPAKGRATGGVRAHRVLDLVGGGDGLEAADAQHSPEVAESAVADDGAALPAFSAGSHIDVQVPGGITRQYSLCNDSTETHRYRIAVLRDGALVACASPAELLAQTKTTKLEDAVIALGLDAMRFVRQVGALA